MQRVWFGIASVFLGWIVLAPLSAQMGGDFFEDDGVGPVGSVDENAGAPDPADVVPGWEDLQDPQ